MKIQFHRIDTKVVVGLLVREFCCSGTDVSAEVLAMYAGTRTPSMEPQWLAAGLSQLTYLKAKVTGVCDTTNSQTFHSTFVLVNCVAIFVTIQYINNHTKLFLKLEKAICSIGECTFGIYLIHVFIRYYSGLTEYMASTFQEKMPAMSYVFLYCGVIFICSYIVTVIIRKIPILKKIVS